LYGDGHVSERVADALVRLTPYIQKRLDYIGRLDTTPVGVADRVERVSAVT
jgi:hypothetical protein